MALFQLLHAYYCVLCKYERSCKLSSVFQREMQKCQDSLVYLYSPIYSVNVIELLFVKSVKLTFSFSKLPSAQLFDLVDTIVIFSATFLSL